MHPIKPQIKRSPQPSHGQAILKILPWIEQTVYLQPHTYTWYTHVAIFCLAVCDSRPQHASCHYILAEDCVLHVPADISNTYRIRVHCAASFCEYVYVTRGTDSRGSMRLLGPLVFIVYHISLIEGLMMVGGPLEVAVCEHNLCLKMGAEGGDEMGRAT